MIEQTKEHFCWVRAVKPHEASHLTENDGVTNVTETGTPHSGPPQVDEATLARMRTTCPEVSWVQKTFSKFPPSPPVQQSSGPFERKTRALLGVRQMTTVHLERPVASFDLDIDMRPIFGSRAEALHWIESEAGIRFCEGALALSLICFTIVDGY